MMKKISKKDLKAFREKHFQELETCMEVAKSIRDDPEAGAKNRIEAVKIIARLLDALKPEPEDKSKSVQTLGPIPKLSPEHQKKLDEILAKL